MMDFWKDFWTLLYIYNRNGHEAKESLQAHAAKSKLASEFLQKRYGMVI